MTGRSLPTLAGHARARWPLAIVAALAALLSRLAAPAPPARTVDAIARMLGDAAGGVVGPDDFIWEERGTFLHDALVGRRVLFLAALPTPGGRGEADLFRARVRLTRTGRAVSLDGLRNLTVTPLGDDRELVARGRRVAFTTAAFGGVQGVSLLDLGGDDAAQRALSERLRAAVEGWLDAGAPRGIARTEITFQEPPAVVRLDIAEGALVMALGPEQLPAALDLRTGELNLGTEKDAFGARARRVPRRARPLDEIAALAARRVLGPRAGRAVARLSSAVRRVLPRPALPDAPDLPAQPFPAAAPGALWPPPAIAPILRPALPDEGVWWALPHPFAPAAAAPPPGPDGQPAADAPPPFALTFLRPDPAHPAARVHLLAVDTRRIELRLQAGYDAPRPWTGPRGAGRLPEGPAAARVLGAVALGAPLAGAPLGQPAPDAAAPWSERPLGMVVDGRVLVPPLPDAPTLAIERGGPVTFGAWPAGEPAADFDALWQGPQLFQRGAPPGEVDELVAERAALCVTAQGFVLHAWGPALDAAALRAALDRAGCDAGVSLGGAPAPLGFAFLARRDDGGWDARGLSPGMTLPVQALTTASPFAFAYLVARDPAPRAPLPEGVAWSPDGGAQPLPSWLPAVYAADVTHLGAQVHLLAFAPDRFLFRVRAGDREISPRGAPELPKALPDDERGRALAAIALGTGRRRGARGLAVDGTLGLRLRGEGGLLRVQGQRVEIVPAAGAEVAPGVDATELPLTADGGALRPEAREIGSMRPRAAACVAADGALLIASTTFDSDEATTEALLDRGCARVVALDRGTHRNAFVHRSGGDPALEAGYDDTVLYAIGVPMAGRARALDAAAAPP